MPPCLRARGVTKLHILELNGAGELVGSDRAAVGALEPWVIDDGGSAVQDGKEVVFGDAGFALVARKSRGLSGVRRDAGKEGELR